MPFEVGFTKAGRSSLREMEKNARRDVARALLPLRDQPKSGKPLVGSLLGFYSLRVRNRFRVVYRVDEEAGRIYVELVGERKPGREDDIYQVARKLLENLGS